MGNNSVVSYFGKTGRKIRTGYPRYISVCSVNKVIFLRQRNKLAVMRKDATLHLPEHFCNDGKITREIEREINRSYFKNRSNCRCPINAHIAN